MRGQEFRHGEGMTRTTGDETGSLMLALIFAAAALFLNMLSGCSHRTTVITFPGSTRVPVAHMHDGDVHSAGDDCPYEGRWLSRD